MFHPLLFFLGGGGGGGACLLIASRSKSIQCDSAKLGSLKLYIFSKGVKRKSIKKALSSNRLKHR